MQGWGFVYLSTFIIISSLPYLHTFCLFKSLASNRILWNKINIVEFCGMWSTTIKILLGRMQQLSIQTSHMYRRRALEACHIKPSPMNRDRGLLPPVYDSSKHQNPPDILLCSVTLLCLAPCVTVISVFFFPPESSVLYLVLTSGCFVRFILLMFLIPTEEDYSRVVATNSISFVQLVVIGTSYIFRQLYSTTNQHISQLH